MTRLISDKFRASDPSSTIQNLTATTNFSQTINLTSPILAVVTPKLVRDTLTITANTTRTHGTNNTVSSGDGANTVAGASGLTTVTLGNGNNSINVVSNTNQITIGNGNNSIVLGGTTNTIAVGSGINKMVAGAARQLLQVQGRIVSRSGG